MKSLTFDLNNNIVSRHLIDISFLKKFPVVGFNKFRRFKKQAIKSHKIIESKTTQFYLNELPLGNFSN